MSNPPRGRNVGLFSLLAVIGISIVLGALLGGHFGSARVALAAQPAASTDGSVQLVSRTVGATPGVSFADIVEQAMPAVVSVRSRQDSTDGEEDQRDGDDLFRWFFGPDNFERREDDGPRLRPRLGEGSGFVISEDGFILTNHHVVDEADAVTVGFQDGTEIVARVVGTDPSIDLALLKVDADEALHALPLGDSAGLRVGEWVIAIGNPLEYEQTVTVGVVSAKNRRVPIGETDRNGLVSFIQTDAAINFGNSGGPLIDGGGNVVGINTAITRTNYAEGIGFALPIDQARAVIEQLREYGYVRRGYIGISMNNNGIDQDARDYYGLPDTRGVLVDDVNADSPADNAGLRKDDIIRSVDGEIVRDNDDLIARISSRRPGEEVRLGVYRRGREMELTATLAERQLGPLQASQRSQPEEMSPEESEGLGITVENLSSRWRERLGLEDEDGVLVAEVEFGSLAAQKGIGHPMVITGLNDERIRDVGDWDEMVDGLNPGQPVKVNALLPSPNGPRNITVFLRVPR